MLIDISIPDAGTTTHTSVMRRLTRNTNILMAKKGVVTHGGMWFYPFQIMPFDILQFP
jgi:hypothetical protein